MARFPGRSSRQIEELLLHFQFRLVRTRGGHNLWAPLRPGKPVPVPRNRRSMPGGTVQSILRQAGISRAQALEFWGIH